MVPTNSITVFLRHNDSELRYMFSNLCAKLRYAGSLNDLVQDFYTRMLTSTILQDYNRHYTTSSKYTTCRLSSYLFPTMRNFVISKMKSPEYRYITGKVPNYDPSSETSVELDDIVKDHLDETFEDVVERNDDTDSCDGTGSDLRFFYESFKGSKDDKRYALRLSDKKGLSEATLSRVFKYIYEGYSNREIAQAFGVSGMYVSYMKQQLALEMVKYGFVPEKGKKRYDRRKMPQVSVSNRN